VFDIAFSELVVIAIVALIVIGPEKLPKVARTLGALTGRMQRYMAQIREEVNREARFEELQRLQQEIQQASDNAKAHLQTGTSSLEHGATATVDQPMVSLAEESVQHQAQKHAPVKD